MQPVGYDPGIRGFVKAHRHPSGAALVMSRINESGSDMICIYWTKRLHHAAVAVHPQVYFVFNKKCVVAAEQCYESMLQSNPPDEAQCDYQRDRVYVWEDLHICPYYRKLSWPSCQRFTREVWRQVGNGSLTLTHDRRYVDAISLQGVIHLPEAYWRKPIILHEIAHELTSGKQHGPEFVVTYIDLCERYLGLDREFLQTTATEGNVHF